MHQGAQAMRYSLDASLEGDCMTASSCYRLPAHVTLDCLAAMSSHRLGRTEFVGLEHVIPLSSLSLRWSPAGLVFPKSAFTACRQRLQYSDKPAESLMPV